MKKEIIITVIIVISILAGNIISQKYTKKSVNETNSMLTKIKNDTLENKLNSEELRNNTTNLYETWKERSRILAYYIEHDEIEKVDTQIKIIEANFEANNIDEVVADIEQGIYLLEHIQDKQELKLKNIF